ERATPQDAAAYAELEKKAAASTYMYGAIPDEKEAAKFIQTHETYLIKKDGKVIGNTAYEMKGPDHGYLDGVFVDPAFQGQGIARKAMEFRLDKLKNVKHIDLMTHPHNSKIIHLYLSQG